MSIVLRILARLPFDSAAFEIEQQDVFDPVHSSGVSFTKNGEAINRICTLPKGLATIITSLDNHIPSTTENPLAYFLNALNGNGGFP